MKERKADKAGGEKDADSSVRGGSGGMIGTADPLASFDARIFAYRRRARHLRGSGRCGDTGDGVDARGVSRDRPRRIRPRSIAWYAQPPFLPPLSRFFLSFLPPPYSPPPSLPPSFPPFLPYSLLPFLPIFIPLLSARINKEGCMPRILFRSHPVPPPVPAPPRPSPPLAPPRPTPHRPALRPLNGQ
jgi:hypothetical protein